MNNRTSDGVINPFSEKFVETWEIWKQYKWENHKFKYKGTISEQMALKQLVSLSDGEEEKAVAIVEQSIRMEWQGLFPLKQTRHSNEHRDSKKRDEKQSRSDSDEARVTDEFNKRYGNWEQTSDGSHLKAV